MSYECHVTIEPVEDARLEKFKEIAGRYKFRVAELLMANKKHSTLDSFCTGHDSLYCDMAYRMINLCTDLREAGFKLWRYKIEKILLDSKYEELLPVPLDPRE